MLKSKCILAEKSSDDGTRISIMSRHTLHDGKTPDVRLTEDRFDKHMPEFAADPKWVGGYYRGECTFEEYAEVYKERLRKDVDSVIAVVQQALVENVTVMCIEDEPTHCHRRIFIEFAQELATAISRPLETEIA